MGNTVGSANTDFCDLEFNKETAYIIGLWCADGYHRTSSIGISNTDTELVNAFRIFFLKKFREERIKMRTYAPDIFKRRTTAYHLYVNSRSLLRTFREYKRNVSKYISGTFIAPYMAGRFDGDGSVAKNFRNDCRIVYGSREEAEEDLALMRSLGFEKMRTYEYRSARTFCLYFSRYETNMFLSLIYPYSIRLQKSVFAPRRDLVAAIA